MECDALNHGIGRQFDLTFTIKSGEYLILATLHEMSEEGAGTNLMLQLCSPYNVNLTFEFIFGLFLA